jgi:hypothetical protein
MSPSTLLCCSAGGAAMCPAAQSQGAARVFRFRSNGQADEWRIRLPQPAALFPELDLSEVGPVARFLDLPRSSREQH